MASEIVTQIVDAITPYLPDDEPGQRDQFANSLRYGLAALEAHGDVEALPALKLEVDAMVLALKDGDTDAAYSLAERWGVTSYLPLRPAD